VTRVSQPTVGRLARRLATAGLTARLVETKSPDVEDDVIKILSNGVDTRVYIQVSLVARGYYVSEARGEGSSLVIADRGSFRSLRQAIDRAIEVVAAKTNLPQPNAAQKV